MQQGNNKAESLKNDMCFHKTGVSCPKKPVQPHSIGGLGVLFCNAELLSFVKSKGEQQGNGDQKPTRRGI
jgi:hypothetical protein